jgi:predicted RNA-binding protein with PIN domain
MGSKRLKWPAHPGEFIWLVDGHNVIFAHPQLSDLQTGGRRAEARRRLEQMCERFATRYRLRVTIVYDGRQMRGNPATQRRGKVQTQFSRPPQDADDRIVQLAEAAGGRDKRVAVISSDRALGDRLPSAAVRVDPKELFLRLEAATGAPAQPKRAGDFADIERYFLNHDRGKGRDGGGQQGSG